MDKIRLLIVSDDSSSRRGLRAIFDTESVFNVLGESSLAQIIDQSVVFQPDIVLIDITKDIPSHVQVVSQLKKECPYTRVLVLAANEHSYAIPELLTNGIDGCLPRSIMRGLLVKTVELVCQTGLLCLPGFIKKKNIFNINNNVISMDKLKNNVSCNGESLTRREMEILLLMAENHTNREIAGKLFISEPTVKTHVSSILRKLGQSNRSQAIVYSYRMGLVKDKKAF